MSMLVIGEKNMPGGPHSNFERENRDRDKNRRKGHLSRNALLRAINNPYAYFEILHDVSDGLGKAGCQVEQSRIYVAELKRLGYTNYNYLETPREGYVFPKDEHWPGDEGKPIQYRHTTY